MNFFLNLILILIELYYINDAICIFKFLFNSKIITLISMRSIMILQNVKNNFTHTYDILYVAYVLINIANRDIFM